MVTVSYFPAGYSSCVITTNDKERARGAFARRFRLALHDLGIGHTEQKRLQRLFGVSGQAVRKWAEGTAMPTPARLPQVAGVLGVRRAWLQDGEEPMRPVTGGTEQPDPCESGLRITPEEVRLLIQYRLIDEEQRRAIQTIVAALAGG